MFIESIPAFSLELAKIARAVSAKDRADDHFNADVKNWPAFEKNLSKPSFRKAVSKHPAADAKLQKYVENYGGYVASKDVVDKVKSRTEAGKTYEIRKLPSGRLGCGCKDWQFKHSHKGSDCDHIMMSRKTKTASPILTGALRGAGVMRNVARLQQQSEEGKKAQETVMRVRMGLPIH